MPPSFAADCLGNISDDLPQGVLPGLVEGPDDHRCMLAALSCLPDPRA